MGAGDEDTVLDCRKNDIVRRGFEMISDENCTLVIFSPRNCNPIFDRVR
jgi:hypothetical protein